MPKYTVTIADVELCINTEESPDMVEKLVETVDNRMRGILSMNPRLSKSMAAIFCAVDYCADKLKGESNKRAMEKELKKLTSELEKLKADYAALSAEAEEVRRENRIMNDLISKNLSAAAAAPKSEQLAIDLAEAPETVPATEVMFDDVVEEDTPIEAVEETVADDTAADAPVEAPAEVKKPRRTSRAKNGASTKNKVGDMFDMLTFKNV